MNGRLWRRCREFRVPVTVIGITVMVAATVGLGVQAVHGAQAVSVQRQSTAARNASLDDAYYGCLDTQAHSLVSPNQSVTINADNLADFIILLKTTGSWVTFADSPSSAAVQLSLRTVSGGGNACRSSVVVAHYATPQHGRSERVGSGASVAGQGPPPAPPL